MTILNVENNFKHEVTHLKLNTEDYIKGDCGQELTIKRHKKRISKVKGFTILGMKNLYRV